MASSIAVLAFSSVIGSRDPLTSAGESSISSAAPSDKIPLQPLRPTSILMSISMEIEKNITKLHQNTYWYSRRRFLWEHRHHAMLCYQEDCLNTEFPVLSCFYQNCISFFDFAHSIIKRYWFYIRWLSSLLPYTS